MDVAWGPHAAMRVSLVCSPSLNRPGTDLEQTRDRPVAEQSLTAAHLGQLSTQHALDTTGRAAVSLAFQGDPAVFAFPGPQGGLHKYLTTKHWVGRSEHPIIQLHLCQELPFPRLPWAMVLRALRFHCTTQQPRGEMRKPPVTHYKDPAAQATNSSNAE